jgi:hypothetical protein
VAVAVVAFAAMELSLFVEEAFAGRKCCKPNTNNTVCTCVAGTSCASAGAYSVNTGANCPLPYATTTSSGSSSGTINSTISCENIPGSGINNVDFVPGTLSYYSGGGYGGGTPTTFTVEQSYRQICTLAIPGHDPIPPTECQLDLVYFYSGDSEPPPPAECNPNFDEGEESASTSTLTISASCGQPGLVATGTLNCNPDNKTGEGPNGLPLLCLASRGNGGGYDTEDPTCAMKLGIPPDECFDGGFPVFPSNDLDTGQVLKTEVTVAGSTCQGAILDHDDIKYRVCNSGKFDSDGSEESGSNPHCIFNVPGQPRLATIEGDTTAAATSKVFFLPRIINTKCGGKLNHGIVGFTIFGNDSLDVRQIDVDTLEVEGTSDGLECLRPIDLNKDGFKDLACKVNRCPNLGPALEANRDAKKRVDITVTGQLPGSDFYGEDTVFALP